MKHKSLLSTVLTLCLAVVLILSTSIPKKVYAASTSGYLTHSPLLSGDTMAVDEIDPWEMECYAVFMSNFCVPFVDAYVTSFNSTASRGSKGAGLEALQFATGGDITSDSIVRNMTTYVIDNLSKYYKPLVVKNYAINGSYTGEFEDKSQLVKTSSTEKDREYRQAVLADLLPIVSGIFDNVNNLGQVPSFDYDTFPEQVWNHAWVAGVTQDSSTNNLQDFTITQGVLGDFYLANDTLDDTIFDKIVFSMRDGWDVQIPSQCLLYAVYKNENNQDNLSFIQSLLDNAETLTLNMDLIGNIGTIKDEEFIVIIPAYLNQHITTDYTINLLGSAFIDSLCTSTDKKAIAAGSSGVRAVNNEIGGKLETILKAGIGASIYKGSNIKEGTSFLYNLATDYMPKDKLYKDKRLSTSTYRTFLEEPFDIKNHLRWSTVVNYKADTINGLDMQNYVIKRGGVVKLNNDAYLVKNGNTYNVQENNNFGYSTSWNRVKEVGNSFAEKCSVFQTAAQLYTANTLTASTERKELNIKFKFIQLKKGINESKFILSGIGEDNKSELVYTPIGADYSGISWLDTEIHDWQLVSASSILNTFKQMASLSIDMLHGKSYLGNKDIEMKLGNAIHSLNVSSNDKKENNIIELIANSETEEISLSHYILGKKIENDITSAYSEHAPKLTSQWVRIAPASGILNAAASYLGLREDCVFSEFASDMYFSYLNIYGFLNTSDDKNQGHIFDKGLFGALGSICNKLTSVELGKAIMKQGLTAEQKEMALKENAYLMLSPGEDGREYRSKMISGFIEGLLIDGYAKTCYGSTDSDYFQTLNKTSNSFLTLNSYSENWLTKALVINWSTVMSILLLFISIIVVIFGTLNGKKLPWIFVNLILNASMLILLPSVAEITPYVVEKVTEKAFKDVIGTMTISEAVEDDTIRADIAKQFSGYSEDIIAAVDSLSAMSTSGSLMLKQDMTRKVMPSTTSETYDSLKGLASVQWLLPNLLSMTGASSQDALNDYVYRSLGEKRNELRLMEFDTINSESNINNLDEDLMIYFNSNYNIDFLNNTVYKSKSTVGNSKVHITNLLLSKLNNNNLNLNDFINDSVFTNTTDKLLNEIASYTSENYTNAIGYLQGTETILPYFYLVAKDALLNATNQSDFDALTVQDYFNVIKHTDENKNEAYSNKLTLYENNVIDVVDLEYLFKVYIPYLVSLQDAAKEHLGDKKIGDAYIIYKDEPKAFLYECNWADKILNAYGYGKDVQPSTYKMNYGRDMIFSRAQFVEYQAEQLKKGEIFTAKNLTDVELRCIEINEEIDKQWTLLINYITTKGVTMDILAEQMALTATLTFNELMSKDRVVNSNLALYPNAVSLRTINFDTMMKMILMSNFGLADTNQDSMKIVLAESGIIFGIILLVLAALVTTVVPWLMNIAMATVFYASILSCIHNACVDSKDKLKTCGGATISTIILTIYTAIYVYSYSWIIGDVSKVLNIHNLSSGTTLATGKLLAVGVITCIYIFLLIKRILNSILNFKDMSFQMWASYSKSTYDGFTGSMKALTNKLLGADTSSQGRSLGSQSEEKSEVIIKNEEIKVKTDPNKPIHTKETNNSDEATYLFGDERIKAGADSGYEWIDLDKKENKKENEKVKNADKSKGIKNN